MNWPLNPPPAGECQMIPLLLEPYLQFVGLEITEEGPFLQCRQEWEKVDGPPVELVVYLCPPDPNNEDSWLAPRGHLEGGCRYLGKIEGPNGTHAVILKQK